MSVSSKPAAQVVTLENAKGTKQSFPINQANELLRLAQKSKVKTWSLKDDRYKFENNEINLVAGKGPDSKS